MGRADTGTRALCSSLLRAFPFGSPSPSRSRSPVSSMENARPLQQGNSPAAPGIESAERNPKIAAGAPRRKHLSDITNLATDGRAAAARSFSGAGKENFPAPAVSNKDAYAQLLKENNALMGALAERNHLIELSGAEIQKLQLMMRKLTLQNQQLARANSQMLAERNEDKERLKAFQHEMGCLQAVLKAKNSELEELANVIKEPKGVLRSPSQRKALGSEVDTVEQAKLDNVIQNPPLSAEKKASNANRKYQSLGSNVSNHQVGAKVKEESTRKSSRRSTNSKHDRCEPSENLLEAVGVSVHSQASDDPMNRDITDQVDPSVPSVSNVSAYPVREEEQEGPPIPANNKKTFSNNRKRALSLGSVVTVQVGGKEKNDYRRKSLRTRSTALKHDPCCPNENLFETEDVTSDDPVSGDSSSQVVPSDPSVSKEKGASTRILSKRSSTGLKHDLCERNENLPEVEDVVPPLVSDDPMREDTSSQVDPSAPLVSNLSTYPVKEHDLIGTTQVQDQEVRRSFGRPMRRAAVKVNSYKEVPLNVKMRRE